MTRKAQNSHKHATVAGSLTMLFFVLNINQKLYHDISLENEN